jgi:4-amino-4-deoxy-L-arabinose transferase-like glycosyltransferase
MPTSRRIALTIALLVVARIALPLVLLDHTWEFHRDELLYFAMGDHLDWFRMQFPPLIAAIAQLGRAAFGDTVWAARVPAAIAGGATLLVMLLAARALGGGTRALVVTALGSAAAPLFVRASVLLQPVVLDQLWCALALLGVVLAIVRDDARWWLLAGVAFGLGTLTKLSAPLYGVVAFVATLAVPTARAQLRTRWPWLAALIALAVGAASITGQVVHGWPFVAQMRVLRAQQLVHVRASDYLLEQGAMLGGAVVLVGCGVWWALTGGASRAGEAATRTLDERRLAAVRWLATVAVLLVGWYLVMRGKAYYAGPVYPLLIAAGAVALESLRGRLGRVAARAVVPAVVAVLGSVLLPLGAPILAPEPMARYAARFGGTRTNVGATIELPQDYADMLGWRAQAAMVARVLATLPAAERARAGVAAANYGQAGALAMHGAALGVPYPVSPVGDFWAWGPGTTDGDLWLVVVSDSMLPELRQAWRDVRVGAVLRDERRVPEERTVFVMVVRGIRVPVREFWRRAGPRWG